MDALYLHKFYYNIVFLQNSNGKKIYVSAFTLYLLFSSGHLNQSHC